MSRQVLLEKLKSGITLLGEDPDEHPLESYLVYLEELIRWNKAYNLTAIQDIEAMITRHILDSLSILPYINGDRCLDVGTGAGLPGMVLAYARPDSQWVLLDSQVKKVRFLQHILQTQKPDNVTVVHSRVEDYQPDQLFTSIVTRAVSSLSEFYGMTAHLKDKNCQLMAMKGKFPEQELSAIQDVEYKVHELKVPGLDPDRFLIIIK